MRLGSRRPRGLSPARPSSLPPRGPANLRSRPARATRRTRASRDPASRRLSRRHSLRRLASSEAAKFAPGPQLERRSPADVRGRKTKGVFRRDRAERLRQFAVDVQIGQAKRHDCRSLPRQPARDRFERGDRSLAVHEQGRERSKLAQPNVNDAERRTRSSQNRQRVKSPPIRSAPDAERGQTARRHAPCRGDQEGALREWVGFRGPFGQIAPMRLQAGQIRDRECVDLRRAIRYDLAHISYLAVAQRHKALGSARRSAFLRRGGAASEPRRAPFPATRP